MTQETNNEIDLLLRRLGRGSNASASHADADHLDADELSLYVENALPAAARARYTEHLAECANCRKLVAQLSSPVGLVNEEVSKVSEISGIRKFLASLFSPMVLRYAVPALGLIIVAAIGFTVLRWQERQTGRSVAELKEQPQQPIAGSNAASPSPSVGIVSSYEDRKRSAATPQPNASKANTAAAPPPNAPPSVNVSADVKQEAPKPKEDQAAAKAPEPAPTATPAPTVAEAVRVEPERRAEVRIAPTTEETKKANEPGTATTAPASNKAFRIRGQQGALMAKDKNEAETRSVGGRRFRKEKGVWIDTAYESSRATVNLTRGSEQYRALVADEPTIKTIAEQLDGEIIVVWKGHAYHIR